VRILEAIEAGNRIASLLSELLFGFHRNPLRSMEAALPPFVLPLVPPAEFVSVEFAPVEVAPVEVALRERDGAGIRPARISFKVCSTFAAARWLIITAEVLSSPDAISS